MLRVLAEQKAEKFVLTRSLPRVVALPLMVAVLGVAGPVSIAPSVAVADSKDEEARRHFRVATALYDSGRFSEAAHEFRLAHDLSKRPQLLYNIFLASRDAGEMPEAAAALRQYLAEVPDVKDREVLEARLLALEKIVSERSATAEKKEEPKEEPPESEPEPEVQPEAQAAAPAPVEQETSPRNLNWLPWTLLGTGVGLVAAGATVGYLGVRDEQKLEDDCPTPSKCTLTHSEVENLKSDGKFKTVLGDALWIPGAVTATLGLTLLIWKPWEKSDSHETPRVDVACSSKACGAMLTGRF